jgi:LPS sulfotransferase NodH
MVILYRTNGPEFDFPLFAGLPPVRYVLASTPRCGSNMLARALWHTGVAGFAEDYLSDDYVLDFFERWGFDTGAPDELADSYIRKLMRHRTSPNGVFGIRIHAGLLASTDVDLHEVMSHPGYIWMRREDRLRQAISYLLAEQTGEWIVDGTYLPLRENLSPPTYSYEQIRRHIRLLDHDTAIWHEHFARRGAKPHVVTYEDLLERYEETVRGCLSWMGVTFSGQVPDPGIRRQAGELTERWVRRYERDDRR